MHAPLSGPSKGLQGPRTNTQSGAQPLYKNCTVVAEPIDDHDDDLICIFHCVSSFLQELCMQLVCIDCKCVLHLNPLTVSCVQVVAFVKLGQYSQQYSQQTRQSGGDPTHCCLSCTLRYQSAGKLIKAFKEPIEKYLKQLVVSCVVSSCTHADEGLRNLQKSTCTNTVFTSRHALVPSVVNRSHHAPNTAVVIPVKCL